MKSKVELQEKDLKDIITSHFNLKGKVVNDVKFYYTSQYFDRMETSSSPALSRVEVELEEK